MINNGTWELFEQTGSVEAYLNYINLDTYVSSSNLNTGSDNRGEPDQINGNSAIINENQRLR